MPAGPFPFEFILFGLTLVGVAVFHNRTLRVALIGLGAIVLYKLAFTGFKAGPGIVGLLSHVGHEWVILTNLLALLVGFALVSDHFERSAVPALLPRFLPADWKGGFVLLTIIWVLSSFLDNIAGALIGAAIAHQIFRERVHIGFVAAIVAVSNAGGAWSVVGDTTTTMIWIAGISPLSVAEAIAPAAIALLIVGLPAAVQQHRYSPMRTYEGGHPPVDVVRLLVVVAGLLTAISVNLLVNLYAPAHAERFPFIGAALWLALLASIPLRRPAWSLVPRAIRGSLFLLALVLCASLMPVDQLPVPSWRSTFGLGFLSAVFDNIPLTALALKQGGYDWGFLAYAVGFGGSMIWFGSSSGVAVCGMFREARSVTAWLRHGWFVIVAYTISFGLMVLLFEWKPGAPPQREVQPQTAGVVTSEKRFSSALPL